MKIALVSCVSKKLEGIHKAKDLYISDWFKKAKAYVDKNNNIYDSWYILSAKYYLVNPNQYLEYYEMYLPKQSKEYKQEWANKVIRQLTNIPSCEIDIFAGQEYRKYLVPLLETRGFKVNVPMMGLGIGQQLKWFKDKPIETKIS